MRTVNAEVNMDKNDGKDPKKYLMEISVKKGEDDKWYIDPSSMVTNEEEVVTVTPVPEATPTMETTSNTILYYNPEGGSKYHRDPNCKTTNSKYLPMQGQFTYGELLQGAHSELKPCHICLAPERPK